MAAPLMAVVSSVGPEHGGKVQGVGAAGEGVLKLPAPAPPSARISVHAREHPGRSRHEAQKTPSQTPHHLSRPACHVSAGTSSPRPQPEDPRLFTPKGPGQER